MVTSKPTTRLGCSCKVGALLSEYGLEDANDELVARWTGQQGDGESVRALTEQFNQWLLREQMRDAGMEILEGQVKNLHRLLTDDDTLDAVRLQARRSLTENGVNVEAVEEDFVSHQSIYRHLTNCLDIEKPTNELSIQNERDRVNSLQNRAESVIDDSVNRLRNGEEVDIGEFEVLINFRVMCEECGSLHDVVDLLDQGECQCRTRSGGRQ